VYALYVIAATAGGRLIFEAFRADSNLITGGLRSAQVTAWMALAIALWLISRRARKNGQDIH
jgi:prolipoprotein diacylglyceryltransferase